MSKPNTIKIDEVEYVRADLQASTPADKLDGYEYVIVRAKDAGCWAGYMKAKSDNSVVLLQGRRLWYWDGAATLSQVAMEGFSKPDKCKFPCEVTEVEIFNHCEIAKATTKAKSSIDSVKVWKA